MLTKLKSRTLLNKKDRMPFGKYKDITIRDIIIIDKDYLFKLHSEDKSGYYLDQSIRTYFSKLDHPRNLVINTLLRLNKEFPELSNKLNQVI